MSVARKDYDACIGCGRCADRCPMDVFYLDEARMKSVIVYPENCQSCGQCYVGCPSGSLTMVDTAYGYAPVPIRALRTFPDGKVNDKR